MTEFLPIVIVEPCRPDLYLGCTIASHGSSDERRERPLDRPVQVWSWQRISTATMLLGLLLVMACSKHQLRNTHAVLLWLRLCNMLWSTAVDLVTGSR